MGLETASFISGLTSAWPLANDKKNQGDDHLRLLKQVLQGTFPNAAKAFYFPKADVRTATLSLGAIPATAMNSCIMVDTNNGADSTITLPTLAAGDDGWWCEIMKTSSDGFGIVVSPPTGTITSKVGATNTIRVGIRCEAARFRWSGTTWYCSKPGPMIGSTENYNGAALPAGYLYEDGSSYSNTTFAELFAVLASSTLKDKRGRADIGDGTGSGLTARVLGTNYGAETVALALAELPTGITSANGAQAITVTTSQKVVNGPNGGSAQAGGTQVTAADPGSGGALSLLNSTGSNAISVTSNNTSGGAHNNIQPSVAVKKIIRAC